MLKSIFNPDLGLLILRVSVGLMMFFGHGLGKVLNFEMLMTRFPDPIGVGPTFSLLLAAASEAVCSLLVVFGYKTRFAVLPLMTTMAVAIIFVHGSDPWAKKEFALLYFIPFLTLLFTGPGKISVDHLKK